MEFTTLEIERFTVPAAISAATITVARQLMHAVLVMPVNVVITAIIFAEKSINSKLDQASIASIFESFAIINATNVAC